MIELEKKFILDEAALARLTSGAERLSECVITDTYFDTADLSLGRSNRWLRERNGKFELKVPFTNEISSGFNEYRELETEQEIAEALGLTNDHRFSEVLAEHRYLPVGTITTNRTEYKKEEFTIDINVFDFGYQIVEIELLVRDESEAEWARKRIGDFAAQHQLPTAPVRGKLFEYWWRFKPELYQKLDAQLKQFELS